MFNLFGVLTYRSARRVKPSRGFGIKSNLYRKLEGTYAQVVSIRTMSSDSFQGDSKDATQQEEAPGLLRVLHSNPKRLKRIKFLGKLFDAHNFELRIAGGAVRDILRGKEPQDIDFATTAKPEQTLEIVRKHEDLLRVIVTAAGQKHGTVSVKFKEAKIDFKRIKLDQRVEQEQSVQVEQSSLPGPEYDGESPYEITTLRIDKFTDGRHAEVEFINDWRQDAERRDLTINAMFLTLDDGRLIDYFDGQADLKDGVVKFVGDADIRIREDYLRILRYFRFWSRYGSHKQPDEETETKLLQNMSGLDQISGERIWMETKKTLGQLPCDKVVELMLRLRTFDHFGLQNDLPNYSTIVLEEIRESQENILSYCSLESTRLSQLVDSDGREAKRIKDLIPTLLFASMIRTHELCLTVSKRLKFSNIERDTILYIIENRGKPAPLKGFQFQLVMAAAPDRPLLIQRIKCFLILRGDFETIAELHRWQVPEFPVSGVVVAQSVRRHKLHGKFNKTILNFLKESWVKANFKLTEEELLQMMETQLSDIKSNPT